MHNQEDITSLASVLDAIRVLQENFRLLHVAVMEPETDRPRLLTKAQAAAYCAVSPHGFNKWCQSRLMPGYVPGTKRYDRHAIDAALDRLSGCSGRRVATPAPAATFTSLMAWRRHRDSKRKALGE